MSYGYVWEKFHLAVLGLATSTAPLQSKLADAYIDHLMHAEAEGVPQEIKEEFNELVHAMTRAESWKESEGRAQASGQLLTDLEAHRLVQSVVSMYDEVAKYGPSGDADSDES
jgi:hypothetical protein